jgi:hypothetical protein
MNENKLKHLEFIQNIITRMNANSFAIKGWSVTLVSALFALAADKADRSFVIIAYVPVICFWALDAFYLSQERQYRALYGEVAKRIERDTDFNLDASGFNAGNRTWGNCVFSKTLCPFHGTLLVVVVFAMLYLWLFAAVGAPHQP